MVDLIEDTLEPRVIGAPRPRPQIECLEHRKPSGNSVSSIRTGSSTPRLAARSDSSRTWRTLCRTGGPDHDGGLGAFELRDDLIPKGADIEVAVEPDMVASGAEGLSEPIDKSAIFLCIADEYVRH